MSNNKLFKELLLTSTAHISKIASGFLLLKLISVYLGVEGLGYLGNFMSLVTAITVLSGGGIVNGVVSYVSIHKDHLPRLISFSSSAFVYSLIASFIIFFILIYFAEVFSILLFKSNEVELIYYLAGSQIMISLVGLFIGIVNGLQMPRIYAIVQVGGFCIGLPFAWFLIAQYGLTGAGLALLVVYLTPLVPAIYYFFKFVDAPLASILSCNVYDLKKLLPFTLMALTSAIFTSGAEIFVREMIITRDSFVSAGLWQASTKLSGAYMGFYIVFLAYIFVPKIAPQNDRKKIAIELFSIMKFVVGTFIVGASFLYFFREFFINLFLSNEFFGVQEILLLQLLGDFFKLLAYTIGYIAVAKAATKIFVAGVVFQSILFCLLSWLVIYLIFDKDSALYGSMVAYVIVYFIYFITSLIALYMYCRPK